MQEFLGEAKPPKVMKTCYMGGSAPLSPLDITLIVRSMRAVSRGVASMESRAVTPPIFSDLFGKYRFNDVHRYITICFAMT